MSLYSSAIVLLKDVHAIQSYSPVLRDAFTSLKEDGMLDILILFKIKHLNTLDQILAETYTLATDVLNEIGKSNIDVKVLFNEHYKELPSLQWDLLVWSKKDNSWEEFDYESKAKLVIKSVPRAIDFEFKKLKLADDASQECIHKVGAVGGTFDHFHDGHKILLTAAAFLSSEKLIVGITDQELLAKKKYQEFLQSYEERKYHILKFLNHVKPKLVIDPIAIRDVAGPTGYIEDIDSLIVSRETVSGGDFINKIRKEKGWHPLKIHVINVIGGKEDDGFQTKLSSTQLRENEHKKSLES